MITLVSIGVYGYSEEAFFEALSEHNVDLFCDIRQRRGVRGKKYRFVNSLYLQEKLKNMGIAYRHLKDLAPSSEIRAIQKNADRTNQELKSNREQLSEAFIENYTLMNLNKIDLEAYFLDVIGEYKTIVFFCVEKQFKSCHRSIVIDHLCERISCRVIELQAL